MDLEASLARGLACVAQAAAEGAQLVVFPETWLSGYPIWLDIAPGAALWDHEPAKAAFAALHTSGISVPGPETKALAEAAASHQVAVAIGVNETPTTGPGNGSIFNSYLLFDKTGTLQVHHRKLMPTHGERLVHAPGDGHGLKTVDWEGFQLGGLICWEHWMPLTRQAMHEAGEHIHLALWPQVKSQNHLASQHYALEGRCLVVAAGASLRFDEIPADFPMAMERPSPDMEWILGGGSAIYGPDGACLHGPLPPEVEISVFEWNGMADLVREKMALDVAGHYNRRDVFSFQVSRNRL